MKKLLFISLLLLIASPVFARIVTDNVHTEDFLYEVGYTFSTRDLVASLTDTEIPIVPKGASGTALNNFEYVIPRDGRLVGMSVAGDKAITAGAATFDVTINGNLTGVQAVIEFGTDSSDTAVGTDGLKGTQYGFIRQHRADTNSAQGFRKLGDRYDRHDADNPYGRATPITAGNRIGVKVSTTAGLDPGTADYIVVIYVLE